MSELDDKIKRWEHAAYPIVVVVWWLLLIPTGLGLFNVGLIIYYGADVVERSSSLSSADLRLYGFGVLGLVALMILLRVWWIRTIKKEIREERARNRRA